MNTQQRSIALSKFADFLEGNQVHSTHRIRDQIDQLDLNEDHLPKLDVVDQLMNYHRDITSTIENTYCQVKGIMTHMKQLKNRKKNVQVVIDCMTSIVQIKKISYGLGKEPKQIYNNLETYYQIRGKVFFMDKFINRIQQQIIDIQKEYQAIFDTQMAKNNSNNIADISKVLQLIRTHTHKSATPDTLSQIIQYCVNNAKKQFKKIEEELFAVPIVGNSQSNYLFFDMSKTAMKIIVTLSSNCKHNVVKVSGEEGFIQIQKSLFSLAADGVILQILMRLRKYYQIDKIIINQSKFTLKEKEYKQLLPYMKQFVAIWNQLERLRIHLLAQISDNCIKKNQLKISFENIMSSSNFVQINSNIIIYMQSMMRFRYDKLLKTSPFVTAVCSLDSDFFRDINSKNLIHNAEVQDFLEETLNRISEGIQKALQTLNTLVISAIINFTNHNLIYQDVFYAFNQLFARPFIKMPLNDAKIQNGVLLALNSLAAFPRALKTLNIIKLPQQIPEARIRAQLQQIVNNNEERCQKVMYDLLQKIVTAEWFRYELTKDYQKILDKWIGLESDCFSKFVQCVCKVHASIIEQTQFSKKYSQISAINFQKEVRSIITFYQRYSHSISPNFKVILDYIQILLLQNQQDFKKLVSRFEGTYSSEQLKKIWNLRS